MDFEALHSANFAKLDDTVTEWDTLVETLGKLKEAARKGLRGKANKANWAGYNATVSREFIGKTAGEFDDAHTQAQSIRNIVRDTRNELKAQKKELLEAIARGRENHLLVQTRGGGFTVEDPQNKAPGGQTAVDALRDDLQRILDKATEIDTTAATALKALVDLTDYGFSGAEYKDRDAAAAAVKSAEQLAALAKKNPEDRSVAEFDAILAGLSKHSGDEIFAEHFASTLGPKGTLEFWAGINDPYRSREVGQERLDQLDDLQKHLSLTLATATQADTVEMATWKREMVNLGDQQVGKGGYTMGFQVMSNLMRWGNYEDRFLTDYGTELINTEKKMSGNGRHTPTGWVHMGMDPYLNRTGTDSGSDPMTGFMKALANSPGAATDFFNDTFVTKDEDHEFLRDTDDDNDHKGKVGLTNFQYLFEERDWPPERDIEGEESITGRNNLAMALEAATTGHPAGEMPTIDTPPHNADQVKLMESIFASVSESPSRVTDHAFMSDSLGQIAAEYMPDINRGLHPGSENEDKLFPVAGSAAKLGENEITRVLYTVGQNPDGYASISAGQHSYTSSLMEYHFANPEAYLSDPNYSESENLKKTIEDVARVGGEIQGTIGAGRAYANELEGGAEDKDFNEALENASTWIGSGVGIGVGIATAPVSGPGGIVAGGVAGTATNEVLSALTEGLMKDSSDEVIYRNGEELSATRDSTYTLIESAAKKAGEAADNPSPHIVSAAATAAEQGFNNAKSNVKDAFEGEGVPKQLDTED